MPPGAPPPGAPPPGPPFGQPPPAWGPPPGGFAPIPQGYPPGFTPHLGGGSDWSPSDAVGFAWERIKADPLTIVGAIAVGAIVAAIPSFIGNFIAEAYWAATHLSYGPNDGPWSKFGDPVFVGIRGISMVINYVTQALMLAGMTHFSLKIARGERYAFGDIFSGGRWFLPSLGISVLVGFGVGLGLILLIIPGVFLALAWSMSLPAAIDRDLGPVEAMGESFRLTEGHRGSILVLFLLLGAIALLGLCACFIGVFVSAAIAQVATAWVYVRLSGRMAMG